ncbi:RDD family protein [Aeromicrobium sp. UC242_57]|uniref:RDD family protein n=1 Tax=Aeromicrobium sp. UC242_57 TaxID=3374624 RepID=UPI0037A5F4BF
MVSGMAFLVVYLTASWAVTGKPLGGSIMGTRVVNRHGRRLGFSLALLRALIVVVFPIGLLWCAVNAGGRSIQDVALRTRVLYDYDIATSYVVSDTVSD